jgi:hypothetical protein
MIAIVLIAFFIDVWPYVSGHAGSIISALVDIQTSKLLGQLEGAPVITNSTRAAAGRHI